MLLYWNHKSNHESGLIQKMTLGYNATWALGLVFDFNVNKIVYCTSLT